MMRKPTRAKKQRKIPAKGPVESGRTIFRFLDLLPEIRTLVYGHYFAGISVVVVDSIKGPIGPVEEDVGTYYTRVNPETGVDADQIVDDDSIDDDGYEDYYDASLTRMPIELVNSKTIKSFLKDEWRDWRFRDPSQVTIHSTWLGRLRSLLLTCKQIRAEAQPILCDMLHLKVLIDIFDVKYLSKVTRQLYLPAVQQITLMADTNIKRYRHRFDVRQMPNLKTLYLTEAAVKHTAYTFVDVDPDVLVGFVHGEKDQTFVGDWLAKEAKVTEWEENYIAKQHPGMQQLTRQKNDVWYWPRQLMLSPEQWKFSIIYRRQLTLTLQNLSAYEPREAEFSTDVSENVILHEGKGPVFLVSVASRKVL